MTAAPINAPQRTAASRCGCNQRVSWPPSLSLSLVAAEPVALLMSADREQFSYQQFSSTHCPISADTEIARYLTFEKFVWLVEKSALYHSRLDQLGDPFEGSVTRAYARKRDAGEPVGYYHFPQYEGINNVRLMLCSFVSCWHASPVESEAMWKLYSRADAGVAVVSTPARMREAVNLTLVQHTAMLGPVEYLDFERDGMTLPFGRTARPGFLKRKSFEHEKEVRGMIRIDEYPEDLNLIHSPKWVRSLAEKVPRGISVSVDLARLIERIYVSPLAPSWFVDLVQTLASRHGLANLVRPSRLLGEPDY